MRFSLGYLCALSFIGLVIGCNEAEVGPVAAKAEKDSVGKPSQTSQPLEPIGESRYQTETKATAANAAADREVAEASEAASDEFASGSATAPHPDAPLAADPQANMKRELEKNMRRLNRGTKLSTSLEAQLGEPTGIPLNGVGGHLNREPERADEGRGPGQGGEKYASITDNPFQAVKDNPLSTFSVDVDTASYSKLRMYLMQHGQLPPAEAVRIEELVNYFDYDYQQPKEDEPFAANVEITACPWQPGHRLVRVGIQGGQIENEKRPLSNLVFLLDVSGSMNQPNKLPLVKEGMRMLLSQLGENDRVAIVVYAGAAGLVLPSTPCDQQETILAALDRLAAGGSTNGGEGIRLAYQTALEHYIPGGVNRVVLCTDGDFNVGNTSTGGLVTLATSKANGPQGVSLSVLGFGMGNHNDSMLEEISNKGNGNYAFIDNEREARKVLVEQTSGTLVTIAKDVKIQIEFNPAQVASYRLIGYENRMLAAEDFKDDKKDAGEIGAGHKVTALYEIVPAGSETAVKPRDVDSLKYQTQRTATDAATSDELLTLKIRYKQPDSDTSQPLEFPITDDGTGFGEASSELKFATAVASFGMLLRDSEHRGQTSFDAILEIAADGAKNDKHGYRAEFLEMVRQAKSIAQR